MLLVALTKQLLVLRAFIVRVAWPDREYADQLKASRDELAAASKTEVGSAALNTLEKRALLTQKASMEKMATEARRWVFWVWYS